MAFFSSQLTLRVAHAMMETENSMYKKLIVFMWLVVAAHIRCFPLTADSTDDNIMMESAGVSYLSQPASNDEWMLGGKLVIPNGQSLFAVGEFGLLSDIRWHWTSIGFGYRGMSSFATDWEELPEVIPFFSLPSRHSKPVFPVYTKQVTPDLFFR